MKERLLVLAVSVAGCAAPIARPPTLGPSSDEGQRRYAYAQYRMDVVDPETAVRGTDLLDVDAVRRLSDECPDARERLGRRPILPLLLGLGGSGLMVYAGGSLIANQNDSNRSDDLDWILLGTGGGVALLGFLVQEFLRPEPDLRGATDAYNQCLRKQLSLDVPPPPGAAPDPVPDIRFDAKPAAGPPPTTIRVGPTQTSTVFR